MRENEKVRFLPSRNGSDWRMANDCFSGGQCSCTAEKIFFAVWRVGLLPDRKNSAHQEMRPPIFSACFSRLRSCSHRLRVGGRIEKFRRDEITHYRLRITVDFLEGSVPALPKIFSQFGGSGSCPTEKIRRIGRCALQSFQPASAGFVL